MSAYRTTLVWLLRLVAAFQIVIGSVTFISTVVVMPGGVSSPMMERNATEQAVALAIGPLVCLAAAEMLALLARRSSG